MKTKTKQNTKGNHQSPLWKHLQENRSSLKDMQVTKTRCSTSLGIGEIKCGYHSSPIRKLKLITWQYQVLTDKAADQLKLLHTAGGNKKPYSHYGKQRQLLKCQIFPYHVTEQFYSYRKMFIAAPSKITRTIINESIPL